MSEVAVKSWRNPSLRIVAIVCVCSGASEALPSGELRREPPESGSGQAFTANELAATPRG
jgi:hypothetical protein